MTIQQYILKLEKQIHRLQKDHDRAQRTAALVSLTRTVQRIFDHGQDVKGSPLGSYSTKPMLVGAKSFKTKGAAAKVFGSKAKRKSAKWVTLKRGALNYSLIVLTGGYKQLRELEGLQTGYVDLRFTGRLQSDFRTSLTPEGKGYVAGVKLKRNSDIIKGLEGRYGTRIFGASRSERKLFRDTYLKEISKA